MSPGHLIHAGFSSTSLFVFLFCGICKIRVVLYCKRKRKAQGVLWICQEYFFGVPQDKEWVKSTDITLNCSSLSLREEQRSLSSEINIPRETHSSGKNQEELLCGWCKKVITTSFDWRSWIIKIPYCCRKCGVLLDENTFLFFLFYWSRWTAMFSFILSMQMLRFRRGNLGSGL